MKRYSQLITFLISPLAIFLFSSAGFGLPRDQNNSSHHNRCFEDRDFSHREADFSNCEITDSDIPIVISILNKYNGFNSIDLSKNSITDVGVAELASFHNHDHYSLSLDISDNKITGKGLMAYTAKNAQLLNTLSIKRNPIDKHELNEFLSKFIMYPYFASVFIDNVDIDPSAIEKFANNNKNPKFEYISLKNCNIGDSSAIFLSRLKIEFLILEKNSLSSNGYKSLSEGNIYWLAANNSNIDDESLVAISKSKSIKVLEVSSSKLISSVGLKAIANNELIFNFTCNKCGITDDGVKELSASHIKYLSLSDNYITDIGVAYIANMPDMVSLDLSNNKNITDKGAKSLANASFKNLDYLKLSNNNLSDAGAIEISKVHVKDLDISGNHITEVGAVSLAHNSAIVNLDLDDNEIGDRGASELARNNTIDTLWINNNKIGDMGAIELAKNTHIKFLFLSDNHVGDLGALAFAESINASQMWNKDLSLENNCIGKKGIEALINTNAWIDIYPSVYPLRWAIRIYLNGNKECTVTPTR